MLCDGQLASCSNCHVQHRIRVRHKASQLFGNEDIWKSIVIVSGRKLRWGCSNWIIWLHPRKLYWSHTFWYVQTGAVKASVGREDARQDDRSEAPLGGRQSDTDLCRLQAGRRTHRGMLLMQEKGLVHTSVLWPHAEKQFLLIQHTHRHMVHTQSTQTTIKAMTKTESSYICSIEFWIRLLTSSFLLSNHWLLVLLVLSIMIALLSVLGLLTSAFHSLIT